jgi:PEP-CTERM motif
MTLLLRAAGLALLANLALPVFGSVVTTATCTATSTGGTFTQTDPAACFAGANIPQSPTSIVATASAGIASQTAVGDGYTSNFNYNLNVQILTFGSAEASIGGTNTAQFTSGGPVRSGFLSITESYVLTGLSVGATHTLNVGSYSQNCAESTFSFPSVCDTGSFNGTQTVLVPFTLGQAFTFSQNVSSSAFVGSASIPHFANGQATVQIGLFEGAPGNLQSVPLLVSDAPEPGSLALLSAGLLGVAIWAKRRRKSARPEN